MDSEKDTRESLGLSQEDLERLFESTFNEMAVEKVQNNTLKTPLFEGSFAQEILPNKSGLNHSGNENLKPETESQRTKTSLRMKYEAEVQSVIKSHGSLEDIRRHLGLSKRKIAQLLMVDPSAWTRWTGKDGEAPPHIYRALQWYLLLQDKHPEYKSSLWLNAVSNPQMHPKEVEAIEKQIITSAKEKLFEFDEQLRDEHFKERRGLESQVKKANQQVTQLSHRIKFLLMSQVATIIMVLAVLLIFQ